MSARREHVIEESNLLWHWHAQAFIDRVIGFDVFRPRPYILVMHRVCARPLHDDFAHIETRLATYSLQHSQQAVIVQRVSFRLRWWYRHERRDVQPLLIQGGAKCCGSFGDRAVLVPPL